MAKKTTQSTLPPRERAFLIGVELRGEPTLLPLEDSLAELALLAETADLEIVGETTQKLDKPNPETYIGSGKVEELKILVEETLADLVIFDSELSPRHQRELEEKFGESVRILDRTALILDIFAQHADTREGILQVELAYYDYRLPRLTRAWTHLARQAGGGGGRTGSTGGVGLRGPGETQLEIDRREINRRITHLKEELEKVRAHRHRYREQRRRSNVPTVAIVGYTNAGKSTLLNKLARSDVYVANQLFATLDPTTRRVELPAGHTALFTDTVGFIQKLPTMLVAAFRATLEEINEADLILHILDVTHPNALEQWQSVQETLVDIGAQDIPMVTALNKIDMLANPETISATLSNRTPTVAISALTGAGTADLLRLVESQLFENYTQVTVHIPYRHGHMISMFHEQGKVESTHPVETYITIKGMLPTRMLFQFKDFMKPPVEPQQDSA